jgi:hypothetical protein
MACDISAGARTERAPWRCSRQPTGDRPSTRSSPRQSLDYDAPTRHLTGAAMVRRCFGFKGGAPGTQEAARGYGGAPRPAQREGEAMTKVVHDDRSEQGTGERDGDLSEADKRRWREHNATVGSPYIVVHRMRLTHSCGGDGTGRRPGAAAHGVHARSGHSDGSDGLEAS